MADFGGRLDQVLDGYATFLKEKELALPKHQPCLVRWVKEFLLFAKEHGGYTFEQMLDLFLAVVGGRVGARPWQLQQAADAVRLRHDAKSTEKTRLHWDRRFLACQREAIRQRTATWARPGGRPWGSVLSRSDMRPTGA